MDEWAFSWGARVWHEIETLFSSRRNGKAEAQDVWLVGVSREEEGSMGCHEARSSRFRKGWPGQATQDALNCVLPL